MGKRCAFGGPWLVRLTLAICVAAGSASVWAQLPSFNGAEGFGGTFTGAAPAGGWFSNATIYHVTTTQDFLVNGKGAPGTLRGAFVDTTNPSSPKQKVSNRIVVFDVGGTFELTQGALDMKEINNVYVAGQTAPSPVTVYGNTSQITHSNNTLNTNVVLRYMTFRKGTGDGADAITFAGGADDGSGLVATNMIVDHVSASWSEDEVLSLANSNTNVTVQYSMMTDSLTSGHQYGSLMRPKVDSQATFHHNLYGNDKSRNPRMGSYNNKTLTLDFVDNVIYNWSDRAGYAGGGSENPIITEKVNANWVGNYAIAGPATPAGAASTTAVTKDIGGNNPLEFKAYQNLNSIDSNHDAVRDGTDTGWGMFRVSNGAPLPEADKAAVPFTAPPVTTTEAAKAYDQVIGYVGNWWWDRDVIDQRVIGNVQNNTQPASGIPAVSPVASELAYVTSGAYPAAPTTHPAGWDADNDGMPDTWEVAHGLNPNLATDFKLDFDNDGYVNIQEYLDEVGAFPAPAPIVFNGAPNARYAQITNWKTNDGGVTAGSNWQPSRFDEAQINSGAVVVDAAGQHAGLLKIGSNAGNNAMLNISSGWLKVENEVVIGADPGATAALNLSGGVLDVPVLSKGSGGSFNFTGGTLHADTVKFSLVDSGGTLAPGHSVGTTHIMGDLTLNSGILEIEVGGTGMGEYDRLEVSGVTILGGTLRVRAIDLGGGVFVPELGDQIPFLAAGGGTGGAFGLLDLPVLAAGLEWKILPGNVTNFLAVVQAGGLAGDYNGDNVVDAADYTVWRDSLGSNTPLVNETVSLGVVDAADYDAWKANFGATAGAGSGSLAAAPEPSSFGLVMVGLVVGLAALRRGRQCVN